jgi:hypothetical protein
MRNLLKISLAVLTLVILHKLGEIFGHSDAILADPVTGAVGAGLGLAQGLFGTKSSQQQNQRSFTQFRPEDLARIEQARGGLETGTAGLLSQLEQSRKALQEGFRMPTGEFQFAQSPDAITRALAAQATQGLAQQAGAQQRAIAQQFRGQPGAGRALQAQVAMQSRLQQNPALFQAFQQQQSRELSQAQQQQAQIDAVNRALLGREQAVSSLAGTGLSAQQQLLSNILGVGQALGDQVQTSQMKGRSGGLLK